jgi:hypothetical protein
LTFVSCKSQGANKILNEGELTRTSLAAMDFIKANDYSGLKNLFAEDIRKSINEEQLQSLCKRINELVAKEGIPSGNNIQPRLVTKIKGIDTIYINVIAFIIKGGDDKANPYKKEITFNFLEKYGTDKISGINITSDPLNASGIPIRINKLDSFILKSSDIKLYRVYYNEGENKKTQFGNKKGVFALEGDKSKLVASKIEVVFANIFQELRKVKIEKIEEFQTALNRGVNTQFIQAECMFDNLPYGIFIYLPLKTDSNYKDKIIVRQMQAANLGYQYYIDINDNEKLITYLKNIIATNWTTYYDEDP